MPRVEEATFQPFLKPGSPPIAGISITLLCSEQDLQKLLSLLRSPHGVLTVTAARGITQQIFQCPIPTINDLAAYPPCS